MSYFGASQSFPAEYALTSRMVSQLTAENIAKFSTLPDSRAFTLRVRYSLSPAPLHSYRPMFS